MGRYVRIRELLVGVEGLALLRHLYDGTDDSADRRLAEVRRVLDEPELAAGEPIREVDPGAGYRAWSDSYDEPGNPIVALEQPVLWSLLESLAPGRALDAACGCRAAYTTPLGTVIVMLRRLAAALAPTRSAQAFGERIHAGKPAGTSNSGISTRSLGLKLLP
jgi:hypothetical protein